MMERGKMRPFVKCVLIKVENEKLCLWCEMPFKLIACYRCHFNSKLWYPKTKW